MRGPAWSARAESGSTSLQEAVYVGTPEYLGDNITKSGRKLDRLLEGRVISPGVHGRYDERVGQSPTDTLHDSIRSFCIKAFGWFIEKKYVASFQKVTRQRQAPRLPTGEACAPFSKLRVKSVARDERICQSDSLKRIPHLGIGEIATK